VARNKKLDLENIRTTRKLSGLNQHQYWSRYGITQSGGSRYESGRAIPRPAAMLIWLRETGKITDRDLSSALKSVAEVGAGETASQGRHPGNAGRM